MNITLYNSDGTQAGVAGAPLATRRDHQNEVFLGRCFIGTAHLVLNAAGWLRIAMKNPVGSGKNIHMYLNEGVNDAPVVAFFDQQRNPTVGLPTTPCTTSNAWIGGANNVASIADFRADPALVQMTGGEHLAYFATAPGKVNLHDHWLIVIEPGNTLGLNLQFAGAVVAALTTCWYEVPIT